MKKISSNYVKSQFESGIDIYTNYTIEIGLWESERSVFNKYLNKDDRILDLGCGTGRTTFHLHNLGYEQIIGTDLTPAMIDRAKELNSHFGTNIGFEVGDATCINFNKESFNAIIFSFNGLMSIPGKNNRQQVLNEVYRVLKKGGIFIFTTHDRDKEPEYFEIWKEEEKKWKLGKQAPNLYEFGDLITYSKKENREIFCHFPSQPEIYQLVERSGFRVIENFYRSDLFQESEKVKKTSGECRFWIIKK